MTDRIFATAGDWALASDGVQWMLMRRRGGKLQGWYPVSFVRSTRDILARCMREKGVEPDTAAQLLSGLPDTFDQWKALQTASVAPPNGPEPAGALGEPLSPAPLSGVPIGYPPIVRVS
jgi:hypothetical protein